MLRLLLLVIALIVYGSLFPWEFHPYRGTVPPLELLWLNWPARLDRFAVRDTLVNLVLYMPLGAAAYLALARRFGRIAGVALGVMLGASVSTLVELAQIFDLTRTPSAFDITCNTIGAAVGTFAAVSFGSRIELAVARSRKGWTSAPSGILLLVLFLVRQLYPLFPALGLTVLGIKLAGLLHPHFHFLTCAAITVEWLTAGLAMEQLLGAGRVPAYYRALLLLLPLRLLVAAPAPGLDDVLGAVAAFVLWRGLPAEAPARYGAAFAVAVTVLVVRGLAPFQFGPPSGFSWVPFAGTLNSDWKNGALTLVEKAFEYGAAVWLLRLARVGYPLAGVTVALVLAIIEAAQVWLPGRTPEITDPLVALLAAFVLLGIDQDTARRATAGRIPVR